MVSAPLALLFGVALAGCASGTGQPAAAPSPTDQRAAAEVLAAASERLATSRGLEFDLTFAVMVGGTIQLRGTIDVAGGQGRWTHAASGLTTELLVVDGRSFSTMPSWDGRWHATEAGEGLAFVGGFLATAESLSRATAVEDVGIEERRGQRVRRLRGSAPVTGMLGTVALPGDPADQSLVADFDVWVADDDRFVRLDLVYRVDGETVGGFILDIVDHEAVVELEAPPEEALLSEEEAQQLLLEEVQRMDTQRGETDAEQP